MANHSLANKLQSLAILILALTMTLPSSQSLQFRTKFQTKSQVFLSPKLELQPGSVADKYLFKIDFPKGHIALKSFDAEVVDEAGNSVPLHETYLHHWVVMPYHARKGLENLHQALLTRNETAFRLVRNSGVCQKNSLGQYFGLGSETRKTPTFVPDPYGIEIGNPEKIPEGFEEGWLLNIHAIDTRGTVDRLGCTECRCDLYNVTMDSYGRPLSPGYVGGLYCCYDETQCRVRDGFRGSKRGLFLRYTVRYLEWSDSILPVKIYIFDVTDTWKPMRDGDESSDSHGCHIEYNVAKSCTANDDTSQCVDTKTSRARLSTGGYVVYGVAHQHTGGIGSTLHGEDGRVICESKPIYGKGKEAGNEKGYIVGMSTCYPKAGTVKIIDGEILTHRSYYSTKRSHTGVMGLFLILVSETKHSLM